MEKRQFFWRSNFSTPTLEARQYGNTSKLLRENDFQYRNLSTAKQSSMRVKINKKKKISNAHFHSNSRGNQNEGINQRKDPMVQKTGTQRKWKKFSECQLREVPDDSFAAGLKRKQSRLKQEERQLQKRWLQEQIELISLSDRFDHVENCTEKHFMELLEGTERLCQTKLSTWKN